jgi:hypothetical protein
VVLWAEGLHISPDELKNNLFLSLNRDGNTFIYRAACTGIEELLEDLLGVSRKKQLHPDVLKKLLVAARSRQNGFMLKERK